MLGQSLPSFVIPQQITAQCPRAPLHLVVPPPVLHQLDKVLYIPIELSFDTLPARFKKKFRIHVVQIELTGHNIPS